MELMEKLLKGAKKEKFIYEKSQKMLTKGKEQLSKNNTDKASAQFTKIMEYLDTHEDDITTYIDIGLV